VAAAMPDHSDRERLDKVVEHMTEQPSRLMAINNGHLGHYMPEHQTALSETNTRALQYLQNIKPRPYRLSPMDKEIQPTQAQVERYNRALDIAQDPKVVLQRAKDGTLLPSDVGDLNAMYPDLYRRMAGKVSAEVQNHMAKDETIPYKSRIGVSLFLGQALDSTMQPASIIAAQPKPQGKPQTPQQATPKRGAASKLGKTNASYMTPSQSAETDRTKGRTE